MRRLILGLLLLAIAPSIGTAREGEDSWENFKQLQVGQKIEVVDMKFKSLKGTFLGFSEKAISLRVNGDEVVVERGKVLRVASRDYPNRRRGAVVGMLIGLGAGGGVGAVIAKAWRSYFDLHRTPWEVAVGGAVIGLSAGAALGAAFPPHQTIYRTKKPQAAKVP